MKKSHTLSCFLGPSPLRLACILVVMFLGPTSSQAQDATLDDVLARTGKQVVEFVDQFSEVKCTERVTQEKLGKEAKIEKKAESTFDYLVILTNSGGELSLDESRLALQDATSAKRNQNTPLLISNGFATLFLIFHPYYAGSFHFNSLGFEALGGSTFLKVHFEHVPNTKSVAALAVRGKEYPLDINGTAWIDSATGVIAKVDAGVDRGIEDIGMKSLHSEVEFAPVRFGKELSKAWFPREATVEVETARQHWRNTHIFSDYKRFSVNVEEQVASK